VSKLRLPPTVRRYEQAQFIGVPHGASDLWAYVPSLAIGATSLHAAAYRIYHARCRVKCATCTVQHTYTERSAPPWSHVGVQAVGRTTACSARGLIRQRNDQCRVGAASTKASCSSRRRSRRGEPRSSLSWAEQGFPLHRNAPCAAWRVVRCIGT